MAFSTIDVPAPQAVAVLVDDETLSVDLSDGRTISVPVAWYPRLHHATAAERGNWRMIAAGDGIHFPDLDEDISVASLIAGRPSVESQASLRKWLAGRGG
jgi:hypothetical protein